VPSPKRPPGAVPPTRGASAVSFVPIDGGPSYFASKSPHSAWMDAHILLGAWLEQPQDATEVGYDAAMGENIYWNLAGRPGKDRADYNVIRAGGMHVSAPDTTSHSGSETVAYDGWDEADTDFGPGTNSWNRNGTNYNQNDCIPSGSQCGYTVSRFHYTGQPSSLGSPGYPINGTAIHQGFGKGVLFLETNQQATQFVKYADILSADSYWMTDRDLQVPSQGGCALAPNDPTPCGGGGGSGLTASQAKLPANYGWDVTRLERLQAMSGGSKPVIADVETGCPGGSTGDNAGVCITPPSMVAAAWHGFIAGARGILWFQHNFSGPCQDLRTFVDGSNPSSSMYNCQQTPGVTLHDVVMAVTAFDHKVHSLNGVLLSSTVRGYVRTRADVSTMAKAYGGACYVFAGAGQPATPPPPNLSATFSLADGYSGPVSVVDENRTVQATDGSFTDTFADMNAVHVYRISGGSTCTGGTGAPAAMVPSRSALSRLSLQPAEFRASVHGPSVASGGLGSRRRPIARRCDHLGRRRETRTQLGVHSAAVTLSWGPAEMSRAGAPYQRRPAGMSSVTTEPIPTNAQAPTVIPSRTLTPLPTYAPDATWQEPPSRTPEASVAKSSTRTSWVRTTCGITTTWRPTATSAVRTTWARSTEPAPILHVEPMLAVGWTMVA
jgi:hypothetical protein